MTDTTAAVAAALERTMRRIEWHQEYCDFLPRDDAAVLAQEVERLTRLHDTAFQVVDCVDSALMDWQQPGCESHFAGVMEQVREAVERYAVVRDNHPATAGRGEG